MVLRLIAASPAEEVLPLEARCIDEQKNFYESLPFAAGITRGQQLPA